MVNGIWLNGRLSKEELQHLQDLIKEAHRRFASHTLPFEHKGAKITFRAVAKGKDLHIFYGWNYPPPECWQKETNFTECANCDPDNETPKREVWCEHPDYNYEKCPYGVPTPRGVASWQQPNT